MKDAGYDAYHIADDNDFNYSSYNGNDDECNQSCDSYKGSNDDDDSKKDNEDDSDDKCNSFICYNEDDDDIDDEDDDIDDDCDNDTYNSNKNNKDNVVAWSIFSIIQWSILSNVAWFITKNLSNGCATPAHLTP